MNSNELEKQPMKPSGFSEDRKVRAKRQADEDMARFNEAVAEARRLGISLHELDKRRAREAEGR